MPRRRLQPHKTAKRRELYARDVEWAAIKAAAESSNQSISRYLIDLHGGAPVGASDPDLEVRIVQKLGLIHLVLERIAERVDRDPASRDTVGILAYLVSLERQLKRVTNRQGLGP